MVEHSRKLGRHQVELVGAQVEAGEPGDLGNDVTQQTSTRFGGRHSPSGYWRVRLKSTADSGTIAGGWMPTMSRSIPRMTNDDDTHSG